MITNPLLLEIRQSRFWQVVRTTLWPLFPGWVDEGRRIVQDPHLRSLIKKAHDSSPPLLRFLNAGAGEGLFSHLLLSVPTAQDVIEIDISYGASARWPSDSRQTFVGASLTDIPLESESVDFILCSEVLEHIHDDGRALDELRRVLAPGGWLLITVPTLPAVFDPAHVREGYTLNQLSNMVSARGLRVV
ncbi:MAG: class I SAM-dependent methyltransferase, partial [Blastocatellia bacterium]